MKPPMSRSRKTLHLPCQRHLSASTQTSADADIAITSAQRGDRDGKSGRVIEVRYRCGSAIAPIVVSTAIDMRKRFFSASSIRGLS